MLSLILPYWERAKATDAALLRMAALYPTLDMEVIIVDDGSAETYYAPPQMPWRVFVQHLPRKAHPKNSCLPMNIGAFSATGDYIALSCPEMLHRTAVLPELIKSLENADYVAAACWAPETNRWHAHSSRQPLYADKTEIRMPRDAQYHFLAVLSRDLWQRCDGFDNDYREGAGYEDNDFLMRLDALGVRFQVRDDLVVDHPRAGARAAWTAPMYVRNREIFMQKWRDD